jgi:uncharacterized membrane protein
MARNQYYIPLTFFDKTIETIGILALIASCMVPVMFFYELPAQIPVHFDLAGLPDDYGSRSRILVLPLVAILLYAGIFFINRYQHLYNYPVPVTPENKLSLLSLTLQMLRLIRLAVALLFFVLIVSTVQVGLGESKRASTYLIIYFLLAIGAIIGIYMYRMISLHKDTEE